MPAECASESTLASQMIQFDFEDLCFTLAQGRSASLGFALGRGGKQIDQIALRAIGHTMLGAETLSSAKAIDVNIRSAPPQLMLSEYKAVFNTIKTHAPPEAHWMMSTTTDVLLGQDVEVCILAAGNPR